MVFKDIINAVSKDSSIDLWFYNVDKCGTASNLPLPIETFLSIKINPDNTIAVLTRGGHYRPAFFACGNTMIDLDSTPNWDLLLNSKKKIKVCKHLVKKGNVKIIYKILSLHNLHLIVVEKGKNVRYKRFKL